MRSDIRGADHEAACPTAPEIRKYRSWFGKRFPGFVNQIWNLVPMSDEMHDALHLGRLTALQVLRYGTPAWIKYEAAMIIAHPVRHIYGHFQGD